MWSSECIEERVSSAAATDQSKSVESHADEEGTTFSFLQEVMIKCQGRRGCTVTAPRRYQAVPTQNLPIQAIGPI